MKETEVTFGVGRHPWLCRWWLKTRKCRLGIQMGEVEKKIVDGVTITYYRRPLMPPCIEFYVPWYAWPLELLHRCVFGSIKLES